MIIVKTPDLLRLSTLAACLAGASIATAAPADVTRPTLASGTTTKTAAGFTVAGPGGARWQLPGGPFVHAEPGAELRVLPTAQPLSLGPGAMTAGYTLVLRAGFIRVEVPKGSKSAVVLAAPRRMNAIVQSGRALAAATATQTAIASVFGATTVSTDDGAYRPVAPGRVQQVDGGKASERQLPLEPKGLRGGRLAIAASGSAKLGKLSWDAVPGAVSYRVRVRGEKTAGNLLELSTQTPSARLDKTLPVGSYELSISALDAIGFESSPLIRPLRILGVSLPEGAYADAHGTLLLGRGQRASFIGVDGLEMTYGHARHYVRAAKSAGLLRDEPTTIHFRFPGSKELASARLAPRALRADLRITPRSAAWPKDPIEIRFRVVDGAGNPGPAFIEPRARITLGVTPLRVAFKAVGGWYTGRVMPQRGAGPWVLRVEIEDQHGMALGRDFVEVVGEQQKPISRHSSPGASSHQVARR